MSKGMIESFFTTLENINPTPISSIKSMH
jgi:hypothetical protein